MNFKHYLPNLKENKQLDQFFANLLHADIPIPIRQTCQNRSQNVVKSAILFSTCISGHIYNERKKCNLISHTCSYNP